MAKGFIHEVDPTGGQSYWVSAIPQSLSGLSESAETTTTGSYSQEGIEITLTDPIAGNAIQFIVKTTDSGSIEDGSSYHHDFYDINQNYLFTLDTGTFGIEALGLQNVSNYEYFANANVRYLAFYGSKVKAFFNINYILYEKPSILTSTNPNDWTDIDTDSMYIKKIF